MTARYLPLFMVAGAVAFGLGMLAVIVVLDELVKRSARL